MLHLYLKIFSRLPSGFWLFTSMDINLESVEKREKTLRNRRERERARRASETAEQREEMLRKRRMRDRARRASQATEDREAAKKVQTGC